MEETLLEWLPANPLAAAFISITLNIFVAISGFLPSAFITVGTIAFFGFNTGLIVLIAGEAAGAIVSFILYRKGLNKFSAHRMMENKYLRRLKNTGGAEAVFLVIFLRILPFVPSGAVTLTAALSKMGLLSFSVASTIGKIPALFIEAYSVGRVLELKTEWQLGLLIFVTILFLIYSLWKRKKQEY